MDDNLKSVNKPQIKTRERSRRKGITHFKQDFDSNAKNKDNNIESKDSNKVKKISNFIIM